jgi:hypothetical protein
MLHRCNRLDYFKNFPIRLMTRPPPSKLLWHTLVDVSVHRGNASLWLPSHVVDTQHPPAAMAPKQPPTSSCRLVLSVAPCATSCGHFHKRPVRLKLLPCNVTGMMITNQDRPFVARLFMSNCTPRRPDRTLCELGPPESMAPAYVGFVKIARIVLYRGSFQRHGDSFRCNRPLAL